ncbi:MAG: aldo/keto reductase [Spirochaetae bacterium HGW-Spirochaetae-1]|jgi:hypothetical protein|nr:MAG: aldo/keto reductase [Spirochaetae bacterium HGW-Spirochaetae-1]
MLYRKMPKNGDTLSILGFGCMRLPEKNGRIDEERAMAQVRHAIDNGVNYIDTAMPYHLGASEPFLGRALKDGYREKVKLATKLPHWQVKKAGDMERLLRAQLKNLNTGSIDYYLIHNMNGDDWERLQGLGLREFITASKKEGLIVNIGFSFHSRLPEFKNIIDSFDWDFCQIQYNYLDEENQAGTDGLEYAAAKGLGVIIMEPLRGGSLAGEMPPAIEDIWRKSPVKRSAAEWSLRWIWNHREVTVVLSGMNNEDHIAENLRIAGEAHADSLSAEELALVREAAEKFQSLMKVGCTGCRYCMPCPSGVDIPGCFEMYNSRHMWGKEKESMINYMARFMGALGKEPSNASLCRECGMCEKECPQELPIQEHLKEVAREFEGWKMTMLAMVVRRIFAFQRWKELRKGGR